MNGAAVGGPTALFRRIPATAGAVFTCAARRARTQSWFQATRCPDVCVTPLFPVFPPKQNPSRSLACFRDVATHTRVRKIRCNAPVVSSGHASALYCFLEDRATHLRCLTPGYPPCGRRRSPLLWQAPVQNASTRRHGSRTIGQGDPDEAFDMYKSTTSAIRSKTSRQS